VLVELVGLLVGWLVDGLVNSVRCAGDVSPCQVSCT